ncbi:MAG TPA: hypothetical protein VJZ75_02370 [Candidatus Bathyarchaeia archaeon]|nr:hypothetical protein [Candidatus Bathyarchaeia archaeon]
MNKDLMDFRSLVSLLLQNMGFTVQLEAVLYKNTKVDILAVKPGSERQAIELALVPGKEFDAITYLSKLVTWPDIDTSYIAIPQGNQNEDVKYFAQNLGVGLIIVTPDRLNYALPAARFMGNIMLGISIPSEVKPSEMFEFSITITNNGQKILANLEATYIPSYPFSCPEGEQTSRKMDDVPIGSNRSVSFRAKVAEDATPDTYPLLFKVNSLGLNPHRGILRIKVT